MPATITKLQTSAVRLRADQAEALRQTVLSFPDLPEQAVGEIVAAIDRETASRSGWTFIMLGPAQNAVVVRWIMQHSSQPQRAAVVWAECFLEVRRDTAEIMLTRSALAARTGVPVGEVSRIMSELETCGAIIRRREKRGVRYFMNPTVGTHLKGAARDKAQATAPRLAVDNTP
jgi:CRP-like cAMP-binding protein